MSKRVRVTVEMDNEFIGLLWASASLGGALRDPANAIRQQTPCDVLAAAVCLEARGAYDAQVHMAITPQWRPHIEMVHAERRVYKDGRQIAGPSDTAPSSVGRADSVDSGPDPQGAADPRGAPREEP